MGRQGKNTLKTYFNTGDRPTEAQFVDLIDSFLNKSDTISGGDAAKILRVKSDETGWENVDFPVFLQNFILTSEGDIYNIEGESNSQKATTLQNAIDNAGQNSWIYVPSGTYDGTITVSTTGQNIIGFGKSDVIITSSTDHAYIVDADAGTGYRTTARNLRFKTPASLNAGLYDAIHIKADPLDALTNIEIVNCHVSEADRDAIHVENGVSEVYIDLKVTAAFDVGRYTCFIDSQTTNARIKSPNGEYRFGPNAENSTIYHIGNAETATYTDNSTDALNPCHFTSSSLQSNYRGSVDKKIISPAFIGRGSGLILDVPIDDIQGTKVPDHSVNGADAVITGAPTIINTDLGKAGSFDGTNDYLQVERVSNLSPDNIFVSCFFYLNDTDNTRLVYKSGQYDLRYDNGEVGGSIFAGGQGTGILTETGVSTGEWVHAFVGYDGTTVYVGKNGRVEKTIAHDNGGNIDSSGAYVEIGIGGGAGPIGGRMKDVMIFDYWNADLPRITYTSTLVDSHPLNMPAIDRFGRGQMEGDLKWTSENEGVILRDRSNPANFYRLYVDSATLNIELI